MKAFIVGSVLAVLVLMRAFSALALTQTEVACTEVVGLNLSGICIASVGPLGVGERAFLTVRLPNAPCFPAVPHGVRVTDGVQGYDATTPPGLWAINSGRGATRRDDGSATNARLYFHVANDGFAAVENATIAFTWGCGL